jgi:hypothetical protein
MSGVNEEFKNLLNTLAEAIEKDEDKRVIGIRIFLGEKEEYVIEATFSSEDVRTYPLEKISKNKKDKIVVKNKFNMMSK